MKKVLETSKGRFIVLDDKKETHYPFHMYIQLYGDNYYTLSEITEEQASSIVDLFSLQYDKYKKVYKLYNLENIKHTFNPIESLHSLLESHNIEITPNTYIFKV